MADELFVLDGLDVNGSGLVIEEFDFPTPKKRLEWAQGADADGSVLVRDPLFENREGTLKLRVTPKATMLLAAQAVAGISRKLEECELNPGGLPLVWTPADGTIPAVTFYVLTGQITDMPMSQAGESGYFVKAPLLTVSLTCKPFAYGAEVTVASVNGTDPLLTLTVPNVAGDVPAEGRLIVTDAASKNRRTVEWGLEQRHYNASTPLVIDSDALLTSGFGGQQTAQTGAYDPGGSGGSVVLATLFETTSTVCGIPAQSHVGTFRVRARARTLNTGLRLRLSWQDGDGALNANPYRQVVVNSGFSDVDLGTITITPAAIGTQQWSGQIEAVAPANGNQISVDYLTLVPCGEGYGRARGPLLQLPGAVAAYDYFTSGTPGDDMDGRTAEGGGTWDTIGGSNDFKYDVGSYYKRSSIASDGVRKALLGSALSGGVSVSVRVAGIVGDGANTQAGGVLARYVDDNNYLLARLRGVANVGQSFAKFELIQVVSGTATTLHAADTSFSLPTEPVTAAVSVGVDGSYSASLNGSTLASGLSAALASGGALETGKPGFYDYSGSLTAVTERTYDEFSVSSAPVSPPAIYSGRTIEFRSTGDALRQNAGGTTYGQANTYRGSRFLVPPAGDKNRTSRIAVMAHRNDLDNAVFEPLGDNLTVEARITPRYLVVGA